MKPAIISTIIIFVSINTIAQSVYNQKWKDNTFFEISHSFDQKIKTEDRVVYEHENSSATLEIRECPTSGKASNKQSLFSMIKDFANSMNLEFDDTSNQFDETSVFITSTILVKEKKRRKILTAYYSKKSSKNYLISVDADTRYYKENSKLIERMSKGILEL